MPTERMPKCPNCFKAMVYLKRRKGNSYESLGYICNICNGLFFTTTTYRIDRLYIGLDELEVIDPEGKVFRIEQQYKDIIRRLVALENVS